MGKNRKRGGRPHGDLFSRDTTPIRTTDSAATKRFRSSLDGKDVLPAKSRHWVVSLTAQHSAAQDSYSFRKYELCRSRVEIGTKTYAVHGIGSIQVGIFTNRHMYHTRQVISKRVIHVPALPCNVLSLSPIVKQGHEVHLGSEHSYIEKDGVEITYIS